MNVRLLGFPNCSSCLNIWTPSAGSYVPLVVNLSLATAAICLLVMVHYKQRDNTKGGRYGQLAKEAIFEVRDRLPMQ